MIALDEAGLFPNNEDDLVETARLYFETMVRETKINPVWVYQDWGVALGMLARKHQDRRSAALYTKAYQLLQMSANAGDSATLQANWSAVLLGEAWQTVEARRADLLGEAERRTRQAESLQPGNGLYNLACVAALQRKDQEVMKNLRLCARYPTQPNRAAFDRDRSFAEVREKDWFQDLVREIYPH
jgi:hypothetical protein